MFYYASQFCALAMERLRCSCLRGVSESGAGGPQVSSSALCLRCLTAGTFLSRGSHYSVVQPELFVMVAGSGLQS